MSTEAMKLAKAWFERNTYGDEAVDVYEALCEALAQPQQEPVALGYMNAGHVHEMQQGRLPYGYVYPKGGSGADVALYTSSPAQRKPLTDEEIEQLSFKHLDVGDGPYATHFVIGSSAFARAIEAACGIKENT